MEADDLMAAIFPALAACQENATGPIEIPDHPLVRQTLEDCCTEAMDLSALTSLVAKLRGGAVALHCIDTTEASVLSHEILNGRPYTFLDDAPLEERRTRAVALRRGIPLEAHDLSKLEPEIVAEVAAEVAPDPRDPDELHDLLMGAVVLTPDEALAPLHAALVEHGRAMVLVSAADATPRWCATERRSLLESAYPEAVFTPDYRFEAAAPSDAQAGAVTIVRGALELSAPRKADELARELQLARSTVTVALAQLEESGEVLRVLGDAHGSRRIIQRIHSRQRDRERRRYPAVSVRDLMRFLLAWQHVAPGTQRRGSDGLVRVIDQLQGLEIAVGAVETPVLAARVEHYRPQLLDELCANGTVAWGRLSLRADDDVPRRASATPSRATPVTLVNRDDLAWLVAASRAGQSAARPALGASAELLEALEQRGALFFSDLCEATGRLPLEVAEGLWNGVARGLITSDGFAALRNLLAGRYRACTAAARRAARFVDRDALRFHRRSRVAAGPCSRWSASRTSTPKPSPKRSPASCSTAGALSFATSTAESRSASPGGRCSSRYAGWKPAGCAAAVASSPDRWASSSPSPTRSRSCVRLPASH
jgi:ATP-dependent Lhr-like helicase